MKLQLPKFKRLNFNLVLSLVLLLVLAVEVYLLYSQVYLNLSTDTEVIEPQNVVRVDIGAYEKTIKLLDDLKSFQPKAVRLTDDNPFR